MSASVILSPNPANPHPNALGLPLGGELLQWGPFQMTNYYLDMYGGPGTVELIGPSSLVNSSFTLDGPSANLVNDGTMRLQQSQLTVGGSLAGYGSVIATQGSTIIAASSVPSQIFYLPGDPPPDQTVTAKSTYPSETITLQSSTLDIGSGVPSSAPGSPSNFFTAPVVMDAASTVNIEGNFTVANQNWGVYSLGGKLGTLNIADGPVTISGGIMQVNANMAQSNDPNNHFAHVEIFNGGRLMLAGSSSGGEITSQQAH